MAFNLGGLLQALGNAPSGYRADQLDQMKLQQARDAMAAKNIYGNALGDIYGGGQVPQGAAPGGGSQVPQSPMPGQPSVPMSRPANPGSVPQAGIGGRPGQVPQQTQAQQQGVTWQQIVQAIKQKNPSVSGAQLADAVSQFQPMMNMQSKQEWQMLQMQLKEQQLAEREKNDTAIAGIRQQMADTGSRRADIANQDVQSKVESRGKRVNTKGIDAEDKVIETQLQEIKGKNGGFIPPVGTPDGKAYNDLLAKKVALRQKKAKMMQGQDNLGTDLNTPPGQSNVGTQNNPIMAKTQEDIDNAPSGSVINVNGQLFTKP